MPKTAKRSTPAPSFEIMGLTFTAEPSQRGVSVYCISPRDTAGSPGWKTLREPLGTFTQVGAHTVRQEPFSSIPVAVYPFKKSEDAILECCRDFATAES